MKKKFFWEIFTHYSLIILLALGFLILMESLVVNRLLYRHTELELQDIASVLESDLLAGDSFNHPRIQELCTIAGSVKRMRITVVDASGLVLGDSENDPALMENHASRPEVHQALHGKAGTSIRTSTTLNDKMFYLAVPLEKDGLVKGVLRVSRSVRYIDEIRNSILYRSMIAGILVLVFALFSSIVVARKIDGPVSKLEKAARDFAAGNFGVKIHIRNPEELHNLGVAMNTMAELLAERITTVSNQRNQLEAILANMTEPVILLDEDLVITRLNKAASSLFSLDTHYTRQITLIEAIRNVELYDLARQTISGKQFVEKSLTLTGNKDLHLQVHATPLMNDQGSCSGILMVMNNITRLVTLENIRKDFVANVSHELKTPITAIQGFVEILGSGTLNDPVKKGEYLGIIAKQAERMNSIISDLLQLSGLENYELKPAVKEECLLVQKLENARKNCILLANRKKIDIEIKGDATLKVLVNGFLIEQAITNLVDNALKYSPEGHPVVIHFHPLADRTGWFEIQVVDRGSGIPAAELPHVFERFYRVDKARSRELGGTGLGLSIVKHIVQAHNGEILVESEFGSGSCFTTRFPGLIG
jgi:two-component system phosphate regulon sensor histidine kinase PhoR